MSRVLFYILITFFVFSSSNASAVAYNISNAREFVDNVSDKTLAVVKSDKLSKEEKRKELENIFISSVDTKWLSRFVLGHYWNETNEEQRKKYQEIYQKFLFSSYLPSFMEYAGQEFVVKDVVDNGDDEYSVQTEIKNPNSANVRVDYELRKKNGGFIIYDIVAEGISLITTQRSEFSSILSRDGIDSLMDKLQAKTNAS